MAEVFDIERGEAGEAIVTIRGAVPLMNFLCAKLGTLAEITGGVAVSSRSRVSENRVAEVITITKFTTTWEEIDNVVDAWLELVKRAFRAESGAHQSPHMVSPSSLVVFSNRSDGVD